jgi:Flp pilus assembly protein TadD
MDEARKIYKQGFDLLLEGERESAIATFREALELNPELAIAWNGLSMALGQVGDLDAAIQAAQQLITLEPDDPLSHANLSRLYQQNGMVPEAEEEMAIAGQLEAKQQSGDA